MWSRNNLKWDVGMIANFLAGWGGAVSACGMFLSPYLLKRMSAKAYTTFTNICVLLGVSVWGLGGGTNMFIGIPLLAPGVNGNNTHAVKGLAGALATAHGLGKGEFSAWLNNMRAVSVAAGAYLYGQYYARCMEQGAYAGRVWWLSGVFGAIIPQVIVWSMPQSAWELPTDEEKGKAA